MNSVILAKTIEYLTEYQLLLFNIAMSHKIGTAPFDEATERIQAVDQLLVELRKQRHAELQQASSPRKNE